MFDRLKEIGDSQAQIVVAMHRNHRLIDVGHRAVDAGNQFAEFSRCGIPNRIRNVDGGGAGADSGLNHLVHVFRIAAPGVLAGEFDIVHQ